LVGWALVEVGVEELWMEGREGRMTGRPARFGLWELQEAEEAKCAESMVSLVVLLLVIPGSSIMVSARLEVHSLEALRVMFGEGGDSSVEGGNSLQPLF
jgi:hypothetical protein